MTVTSSSFHVSAGASFELPIPVSVGGTKLSWSFHTENADEDIQFSIEHLGTEADADEVDELYNPGRVKVTETKPHTGEIVVQDTGIVTLNWDNSYSWLREKVVSYEVDLAVPEPEERSRMVKLLATATEKVGTTGALLEEVTKVGDRLVEANASVITLTAQKQDTEDLVANLDERRAGFEEKYPAYQESLKAAMEARILAFHQAEQAKL